MDPEEFKKRMEQLKKEMKDENAIKPETTGGVVSDSKNVFDLDKLEDRGKGEVKSEQGKMQNTNAEIPNPHPSGLRTLTTDIAEAARNEELSVIKIALAEQRKKDKVTEYYSPKSKKNLFYIFASIIFVLLSLLIIYLLINKNKPAPVENPQVTYNKGNNIIAIDGNKIINLTKLEKDQALKAIRDTIFKDAKNDFAVNYYFTDDLENPGAILDSHDFFNKFKLHAPITFVDSIEPQFMFGAVGQSNSIEIKNIPFLIIKVADNQSGVSGMYAWEKTMLDDFYLMWNINIGGANTTLLGKNFQNTIIQNKDARILVDETGKITIMYLFLDDKTILITTTDDIIQEIMNRFYNAIAN